MRLNEANLKNLPTGMQQPTYDRKKVDSAIVHLGIGAFHRAHQAMFTDAVLASGDLAWGIVGAGGIGGTLFAAFQRFEYDFVLAILLTIIAVVLLGELAANAVKRIFNV